MSQEEQEIIKAFEPVIGIAQELSTIRSDQRSVQGIEAARREQERLERQGISNRGGRSGRNIQASVGSGARRDGRSSGGNYGSRYGSGGYRSGGSYYSPSYGRGGSSSSSYGRSGTHESSFPRQSSSGSRSSSGSSGSSSKKSSKEDAKKNDTKKTINQLKNASIEISKQIETIEQIAQNHTKKALNKDEVLKKEREILGKLSAQGYFATLSGSLQNYTKALLAKSAEPSDATLEDKNKSSSKDKKKEKKTDESKQQDDGKSLVARSLEKGLPLLLSAVLNAQVEGRDAQQLMQVIKESSTPLFGSPEKIKSAIQAQELKYLRIVQEFSNKPEATRRADPENTHMRNIITTLKTRLPLEWIQKSEEWDKLETKLSTPSSTP